MQLVNLRWHWDDEFNGILVYNAFSYVKQFCLKTCNNATNILSIKAFELLLVDRKIKTSGLLFFSFYHIIIKYKFLE